MKHINLIFLRRLALLFLVSFFCCLTSCKSEHVPRGSVDQLALYMIRENKGLWDGAVASAPDVQAITGFSIEVAGKQVFFYEFDDRRKKGKAKLEYIKEKGYLYVLGFKFAAITNGRYVMVGYDENPKADQLVKTFLAF